MKKMKAADLILDTEIYPRNSIDPHNVNSIADAMAAGVTLPPVVIDKVTKKVVDGWHRVKASIKSHGDDAKIEVVEKAYKNVQAMFLDAMRYNASHGAKLDTCDRTHCLLVAEKLSIPPEAVAGALCVPVGKLGPLRTFRVATAATLSVPLKRTVSHFAGRSLTPRQVEANENLSGMNQVFYANQLIELLESDMLDTTDEKLMARLAVLGDLLGTVLAAA